MANDLTQRPWIVDTATTIANPTKSGKTWVQSITFQNYTGGAGSLATIQDSRGRAIASLPGAAGNTPVGVNFGAFPEPVNGLTVTAIDSGQLIIGVR